MVRNSENQTAYWEATVATAAPPTPNWSENMRIGSRTTLIAFPATTITAIAASKLHKSAYIQGPKACSAQNQYDINLGLAVHIPATKIDSCRGIAFISEPT